MKTTFDPEPFVQRQLEAHNARDLDSLHAELVNRMVFGNKVIDQERQSME